MDDGRGGRSLKSIPAAIRYRDALIFQAPSVVGLAFSFPALTSTSVARILLFLLGGFLLMAHIFALNDWSDRASDAEASRKGRVEAGQTLSHRQKLVLAVGLGAAAIGAMALLSTTLLILGTLALLLGVAYSFPVLRFKGKGIPVLSSFLHITGTVITFLLGYALFSPLDVRALLIGGYFALIITAGHLVQEVQDFAGDRATDISTNAVRFGPGLVFLVSFVLFTLSFAYLFGLAAGGSIPSGLRGLLAFYPVYAFLAWRTFRAGLNSEQVHRFRGQYRILFAALVSIMAAWTVLG